MDNSDKLIMPGARVLVFDHLLFKDDVSTPLSFTERPATVLCRYGYRSLFGFTYPDLLDVKFDHREQVSHGHFTKWCKEIK